MVTVELEVGYCDTRAEDLGWSLDLEPQPALAARELAGSGFLVELRLLGASHQVVVRAGPDRGSKSGSEAQSNSGTASGPDPGTASKPALTPISGRVPGLDSGPICLETLVCIPDRTYPVPAETQLALGRWRYTFRSNSRQHGPPDFARLLAGIEREAESGILGRYPGAPGAVTAIALDCDGPTLRWSTWHTYPGQGVIVTTHSTLSDMDRLVEESGDPADSAES